MDEQALKKKKKKLHDLQFDIEVPLSYVAQHSFLDAHESNENMFLFVQTLHSYSVMIPPPQLFHFLDLIMKGLGYKLN